MILKKRLAGLFFFAPLQCRAALAKMETVKAMTVRENKRIESSGRWRRLSQNRCLYGGHAPIRPGPRLGLAPGGGVATTAVGRVSGREIYGTRLYLRYLTHNDADDGRATTTVRSLLEAAVVGLVFTDHLLDSGLPVDFSGLAAAPPVSKLVAIRLAICQWQCRTPSVV